MKKFDNFINSRIKWSDPNHIKNHPLSCDKNHSFCHIQYQWEQDQQGNKLVSSPINPSLPNINLDNPKQPIISINYQSMTEQNLDDWIAQSMNRNLASLMNPQKKFFIPSILEQDLKQRYKGNQSFDKTLQNQTYFHTVKSKTKQKSYLLNDKKNRNDFGQLCFNYTNLQPIHKAIGIPIKIRENRQHNKIRIRRRNAVLLSTDIHYERLIREMSKQNNNEPQQIKIQEKQIILTPCTKDKLYCFNVQNLKRKSCYEQTPSSIIEQQFKKNKQPNKDFLTSNRAHLRNQQLLQEKYRSKISSKTENTLKLISGMIQGEGEDDKQQKNKKQQSKIIEISNGAIKNSFNRKNINIKKKSTKASNNLAANEFRKDRQLQSRVMKLLNNMQVQSEIIDDNMVKLNIHVNQIFLKHPDSRSQVKWILKAQERVKDNKYDQAIDCYKQAIILQPEFFIPVFNIAVLLEKLKLLNSALMWFYLARNFQTDSEIVTYGIALVLLKQLKYQESLKEINDLINYLQNGKKPVENVYYYIRTLCYKQLGKFQQAKMDYTKISEFFHPSNYNYLSNFLFSIVFAKSRQLSVKFNCLSYMNWRQTIFMAFLQNSKKIHQQSHNLIQIAQKLIKLPFFCRFSISLIRKLLLRCKYQLLKKQSLFFIKKNESALMISGLLSIKNHEKNYSRPDTISVLQQGGIIGGGQFDHHISSRPNNWYIASTDVQLLILDRNDFKMFWNGQITYQFDFKYNFLRNVRLFHNLSQATLFKLCQLMVLNSYDKNTILFNDGAYKEQIINKAGHGFGLCKKLDLSDPRFVNIKKPGKSIGSKVRRRGICRILQILRKYIFKFNDMKFNRLKYPGLFVLIKGNIEVQNDRGFRCENLIGEMDFFGENLIIDTDGLHNYGRMVVVSETAQFYTLPLNQMIWAFTAQDKQIMHKNCQNRKIIDTVCFLRNQFQQCQQIKLQHRLMNN